ncbi:MAG TPA: patatin-like phospholipase family protein [Longimicrobiales bacterium]
MTANDARPRLGLALGAGAARGWAHIGVLRALAENDVHVDVVCGTSAGALVGGIYATGKLRELEDWVRSLTARSVLALTDFTIARGGAVGGRRLMELYRDRIGDPNIEDLPLRFAAVATDLESGSERWLQQGSLLDAIRASISVPGLFTPVERDGRWLVDGGLVNPVPVTLCRALGAEVVVAVDLNRGRLERTRQPGAELQAAVVRDGAALLEDTGPRAGQPVAAPGKAPIITEVVAAAIDIMEDRIARARLAGDPPDLLLTPRLRHVAPLDFAGGQATIDEGFHLMERMLPTLHDMLGDD